MFRRIITGLALIAATGFGATAAHADLNVVTTVPDLAALASAVGGKHVNVKSLSLPTQDPHWVDAKPSLVLDVNRADMLIAVGSELEVGWLPVLQHGARNPKIQVGSRGFVDCSRFVELMEIPTGKVSRSEGDVHPSGNPHYLYDPRRALVCARGIARTMMELDPERAEAYERNLAAFERELEQRRKHWEAHMRRHRGTPVIAYHKSWPYLADWLGLEVVDHIEPKPGIPPSPRHVVQVIKTARAKNVKVILQEGYYPSKTGQVIADKSGATLVEVPGGTQFDKGETYLQHIDDVVARIDRALTR